MNHCCATIDIKVSPDRVWPALREIDHWSECSGSVEFGSRALIRQPKLLRARWPVTQADNFAWITRSPGIRLTARHSMGGAADSRLKNGVEAGSR